MKYRRTAIILSGGVGNRMEGNLRTPKQYMAVAGRPVIEHTLLRIREWRGMDSIIIVAEEKWQDYLEPLINEIFSGRSISFLGFSFPGNNRQLSILNALRDIKEDMSEDAVVMVHDAVRPRVSEELLARCDAAIGKGDGVMPYLHIKDTVYISEDGDYISENISRDRLYAGQTPEFYNFWKYLDANEALSHEEILSVKGSSEPAVMRGMRITLVQGDEANFKITTKEDMEYFRRIKEGR
ncbi:MAG: 2-C-methyl-D-erythritol 4-phosphate cytidylyltransferase [Lachnospiraceae bacterium]|nr:2-C-methyl-D-erythritol 4-phosphate cytidylyltransferase [Lachnospiraceae bacterium]